MIAALSGTVTHVGTGALVIDVGGVGIAVQCAAPLLAQTVVGVRLMLSTSLIVREDSLTLYGFSDADERDTFQAVQTMSGIGPRLALAVLTALSPDQLRAAVGSADEYALTKISGIGKKGAQRMILELGDKLGPPRDSAAVDVRDPSASPTKGHDWQVSVRDALMGLGWTTREADQAVAVVVDEHPLDGSPVDVSRMLALALRSLGRR